MARKLLCSWPACKERFEPRGNQRYCSRECSMSARRVQNRQAQRIRRKRLEWEASIQRVEIAHEGGELSALRTPLRIRWPYLCDCCNRQIARPRGQIVVLCSRLCRSEFRSARRRRLRRRGPGGSPARSLPAPTRDRGPPFGGRKFGPQNLGDDPATAQNSRGDHRPPL